VWIKTGQSMFAWKSKGATGVYRSETGEIKQGRRGETRRVSRQKENTSSSSSIQSSKKPSRERPGDSRAAFLGRNLVWNTRGAQRSLLLLYAGSLLLLARPQTSGHLLGLRIETGPQLPERVQQRRTSSRVEGSLSSGRRSRRRFWPTCCMQSAVSTPPVCRASPASRALRCPRTASHNPSPENTVLPQHLSPDRSVRCPNIPLVWSPPRRRLMEEGLIVVKCQVADTLAACHLLGAQMQ
jgi:hypothetical protein